MNPVGMIQGNLFDRTRSNWAGDGPRPIGWTAWYPTEAGVAEEDVFIGSYFTMGPVAIEAPLVASPARFPVVLLSHGTGGSAVMMGWIGRRLAQAGFVAIAVDHHGNCGSEPYQAEGFICWWERPADLSVALTELASQSPFEGRLNLNQAFAAGFSLGGYTVLSLAGALTDHSLFEQWLKTQPGFTGPREFPDLAGKLPDLLKTSNVFRQSFDRQGHCYRDPRVKAIY
ncbi:MAG: alpha/beta hydrolase, partial [Pseudomonadota bacterium]